MGIYTALYQSLYTVSSVESPVFAFTNLKNTHYAMLTVSEDGAVSYGTPVPMPGSVSISLDLWYTFPSAAKLSLPGMR